MNSIEHIINPVKQSKPSLARSLFFQPKLTINQPNDIYEQEADAVAEKVMRMTDSKTEPLFFQPRPLPITPVQRKCTACGEEEQLQRKEDEEDEQPIQLKPVKGFDILRMCADCEEEEHVQTKSEGVTTNGANAPSVVHDVIHSTGRPLDVATRNFMESRFGYDFSNVQIHNDPLAHRSSKEINALAYTHGDHVVFGPGQYQPHTHSGKQLLAHELAHVVQQRRPSSPHSNTNKGTIHRETAAAPVETRHPNLTFGGTNDLQNLTEVMTAVQTIEPAPFASGLYMTKFRGQFITLTVAQRDQLILTAKKSLLKSLNNAKRDAEFAKSGYETQKKINEEHWIVSATVLQFAQVEILVPYILENVRRAKSSAILANKALQANNFIEASKQLATCEQSAKFANILYQRYHDGIISTGESIVTVLEYTRDASFITLGILAVIVTGGAAAAGAGAVTTTTAFGVEVAAVSTANLIATAAPVVATLGDAGMRVALGDKVDWAKVGLDVLVNILLSRFGGKISQTIFQRMLGNSAVRSLGAVAFGRIFSSLVTHELSTGFTTAVNAVYQIFKGKKITWEQFSDELVNRLTDPKGLFVAGLMGAVVAHGDAKLGGAKGVIIYDKKGNPIGDADEVKAGVIREKKTGHEVDKINPQTGKPYPGSDARTWALKHIYEKTKKFIENLGKADHAAPAKKIVEDPAQGAGSSSYPSVKELQGVRKYEIQIEADTPTLRAEVEAQLGNLRSIKDFSEWTFTAVFGKK